MEGPGCALSVGSGGTDLARAIMIKNVVGGVDDGILSVGSGYANVDRREANEAEGRSPGENIGGSLVVGVGGRGSEIGGGGPWDLGASGGVRESSE